MTINLEDYNTSKDHEESYTQLGPLVYVISGPNCALATLASAFNVSHFHECIKFIWGMLNV